MRIELTKEQILKRRRISGGLEPLRADYTIELTDGIDVNTILLTELRNWYLDLLANGDRGLLATENLASAVTLVAMDGGLRIEVPDNCRRMFDVRLNGWNHVVAIRPSDEFERIKAMQQNPFTAATANNPVAVFLPGNMGGKTADIAVWPGSSGISLAVGVVDPGENLYIMDEMALTTMPSGTVLLD